MDKFHVHILDANNVVWVWDRQKQWLDVQYPAGETPEPGSGYPAANIREVMGVLEDGGFLEDDPRPLPAIDEPMYNRYFNALQMVKDTEEAIQADELPAAFAAVVGASDNSLQRFNYEDAFKAALNRFKEVI